MAKIFIDAGHGGKDPGAVANGIKEKDVTLKVAKYLESYLEANYSNADIKQSRTGDTYPELISRTNAANAWKADALVSIHVNAGGGEGYEDFRYTTDNADSKSYKLQKAIHDKLAPNWKNDRGMKTGNLHMVREFKGAAVLVELGFADNASDAGKLKSDSFLKEVAKDLGDGIAKYLKLSPKKATNPAPSNPKPAADVPGKDKYVHRVIVDGKQVGAYGVAKSVGEAVEKAVAKGAKKVEVERV